ncbi:lysozyme [Derxia gummosa]|uniref:Lysozyme n=1 Tax=Derxia gummosa DSM 723 TaxID=1121388 RepID=A0A8B6X2S4_9BURK|nr:lysozyme [Derxia gummosa]
MIAPTDDTLAQLCALIKQFEGLSLRPYLCPAGVPTIGYGSTRYEDGRRVDLADPPIAPARADAMLERDARAAMADALALSPGLRGPRLVAIADFVYNLGAGAYGKSTLRQRVDAGDWRGAVTEINRWVNANGKPLAGLVKRRGAEARLLEGA